MQEYAKSIISKSLKFADVMSVCHTLLKHAPEAELAREYLKTRIPKDFNKFIFGYFPPNDQLNIYKKYAPIENLLDLGLVYGKNNLNKKKPEPTLRQLEIEKSTLNFDRKPIEMIHCGAYQPEEVYCGILNDQNLIMPYQNLYGDIIGFVGRRLDDSKGVSKYKNTSLTKSLNLFALSKAKQSIIEKGFVIVVEGQFDCITCHRFGYTNTVALGGTAFSKFHFSILQRYAENILLALDNDEAGLSQTKQIMDRYGDKANIKTIIFPEGVKDIDQVLQSDKLFLEKFRYII